MITDKNVQLFALLAAVVGVVITAFATLYHLDYAQIERTGVIA